MGTAAARRPLIYATKTAQEQAARHVPGRVIENEVGAAIMRGDITHGAHGGVVFGESETWVAHVERVAPRVRSTGRAWLVIKVESHHDRGRRHRDGNKS